MENAMQQLPAGLKARLTPGSQIAKTAPDTWRLSIPSGSGGRYRLAQLDDYSHLPRQAFRWKPGLTLSLQARAASVELPGTWGLGLWNDPFSMGVLSLNQQPRGRALERRPRIGLRLPTLPNAAWFFFASPQSYLSLRDDLPASGRLAATFCSPLWPPVALLPASLALPFAFLPPFLRLFRRWARRITRQASAALDLDPTEWHTYRLIWEKEETRFQVDGQTVLQTDVSPRGALGVVIWVDNQFMALSPVGQLGYGMLANPEPVWIEVRAVAVQPG